MLSINSNNLLKKKKKKILLTFFFSVNKTLLMTRFHNNFILNKLFFRHCVSLWWLPRSQMNDAYYIKILIPFFFSLNEKKAHCIDLKNLMVIDTNYFVYVIGCVNTNKNVVYIWNDDRLVVMIGISGNLKIHLSFIFLEEEDRRKNKILHNSELVTRFSYN